MSIELPNVLSPRPGTDRDRDHRYYRLVAGGARTRLLEGFLDLGLPELLGATGPMTAGPSAKSSPWTCTGAGSFCTCWR